MLPAGLEPEIPAIKLLQNYALSSTATGIGIVMVSKTFNEVKLLR
jgi:hypothetical protein